MKKILLSIVLMGISQVSFASISGDVRLFIETEDETVAASLKEEIVAEVLESSTNTRRNSEELAQEIINYGNLTESQKPRVANLLISVKLKAELLHGKRIDQGAKIGAASGAVLGGAFGFLLGNFVNGINQRATVSVIGTTAVGATIGAVAVGATGAATQLGTYKISKKVSEAEKKLK